MVGSSEEWGPAFLSQTLDTALPLRVFIDDESTHLDLPRIGGTLSHLITEYKQHLADGTIQPPEPHEIATTTPHFERLHSTVLLFLLTMMTPLRRLQTAHESVMVSIEETSKALDRLGRADPSRPDAIKVLEQGCDVVRKDRDMKIRCVTLIQASMLGKDAATALEQWTAILLRGLIKVMEAPKHVLGFVPEGYMTVMITTFSALHCESSPFGDAPAEPYFLRTPFRREWLLLYTKLIFGLMADPRVVSPDLSVAFILAAKTLLAEQLYLNFIQSSPDLCTRVLRALMACYDGRFWVPSTDILVQFWNGVGFAFETSRALAGSEAAVKSIESARAMREALVKLCETFKTA
jgi:hypothetical protein